ncbi:MAG: ComEC/Rec2 family competence protein [Ruminococcaceae bacterium]|nr:ComEC/Rec2 family competence protein [Oscillospiraceae bacterium]
MKRLLGLLGLTCLLVLTACFYLGETAAIIFGFGALFLFAVSMFFPFARKEGTYPVAFITAVITVCIFLGYTHFFVTPIKVYDGKKAEIVATQEDAYFQNGYYNYVLKVNEINGEDVNFRLLLLSKSPYITEYGDELRFTSEVSFKENKSFWARRIFLQSYIFEENAVEITKPYTRPFMYYFKNINNKFSTALYLEMGYEEASFSSAVLLGNKHALSIQMRELLRNSGLSHIAVVSGLHLSIIAAMVGKLFDKLFKNTIIGGCFTTVSIISFALLCGFGVPVIRASVMLIIFNIGKMIGRRSDSINSIGAAALILTVANPYCVGDVGLLLSFSATLGIVFWSDKLSRPVINKLSPLPFFRVGCVNKIMKAVVNTIFMSLSATIWTLPITILVFGGVSTVSLIANLLIVPFMWIVLITVAFCIWTHYVEFLSVMCDWLCGFVSLFYDYLIFICKGVTSFPNSYVYTDKPYFYIWLGVSFLIAGAAILLKKRSVNIFAVLLSALILFTGALNYNFARERTLTLHILEAGNGMSVLLESSDGYAVLRASGSNLKTYIVENKIDTMHNLTNSVYIDVPGRNSEVFYTNIVNQFDYDRVLRYDNIVSEMNENEENITYFGGSHSLDLWSKAKVSLNGVQDNVFEYIKAGDTTLLIAPRDSDCSKLSAEYLVADIIITDGIPYSYELLECDRLYIVGESYTAQVAQEKLLSVCENIVRVKECSFDIDI